MLVSPTPPAAPPPALDKAHADLKKATQQFESYFLNLMLKEMRKTVPQEGMMGEGSNQQQIFQDMLDQTLADTMSRRGDLGVGKLMYDQLAPSLGPTPARPPARPKAEDDPRR